ncbi:MAG TPA: AmmeMemoRadiSam system protein B [Nitrospirae bacterium]|nr:AmmeMemoRadiSam system protein B [Nitrospirota bacterium]
MKRTPAVAGQFYSDSSSGLAENVRSYMETSVPREKAVGVLVPHAGLMYSGHVAGAVYSRIEFPRTFILIGPNHTGIGKDVSIMTSGEWEVPTGRLKVDRSLAKNILERSEGIEEDASAHTMEHSLEVQLPFILHYSSSVQIVPILIKSYSLQACREVGEAAAAAIKDADYPVTIVASSDMSHYVSESVARSKDKEAIDRILALDPPGLYNTVIDNNISMCGFAPATAMLYASLILQARKAVLVKYSTSGEISGDYNHVVGYAGILII